jgi:hypothetical protein
MKRWVRASELGKARWADGGLDAEAFAIRFQAAGAGSLCEATPCPKPPDIGKPPYCCCDAVCGCMADPDCECQEKDAPR